ncbi:MAG: hypothetical protein LBJ91_06780, partial [Clostridiales Family XIII bacterium]|nr:hypothetical protein [Clostridiales Family XIII bacterium]
MVFVAVLPSLPTPAAGETGAAAKPPTFTHDPDDSVYSESADARFYVRADSIDNGYLTYEWRRSKAYSEPQNKMTSAAAIKADAGASAFDPSNDEAGLKADGTKSVLDVKTPEVNGMAYYYYWVRVTNHVDSNGDGDTDDDDETNWLDSGLAEAKVVDRTLEDHIINGDFSTIVDKGLDTPGIRSEHRGWGSFPNEMIPGWDTTHFQVNQAEDSRPYAGKQYEIQSLDTTMPNSIGTSGNTTPDDTTAGHGLNGSNTAPYYVCELADQDYSSIYQEIATVPGKIYEWSLQHSAINSSQKDVMAVIIGASINEKSDYGSDATYRWVDPVQVHDSQAPYVGDRTYEYPYGQHASAVYEYGSVPSGKTAGYPIYDESSSYFYDILMKLAKEKYGSSTNPTVFKDHAGESYDITYNGNIYYIYIASSGTKWTNYNGSYTIPAGQGTTVFSFVGISSPSPSGGNFLDNVVFASGTDLKPVQDAAYSGDSSISTPTKSGYAYALAEVRGSSVKEITGLS